jgi:hypothetical protein
MYIVQTSIKSLTAFLAENNGMLDKVAVHPATNFPGRNHENVLLQLLRKKPEPAVETRLDLGKETASRLTDGQWKKQHELWRWANKSWEARIIQYVSNEAMANYTVEEAASGIEHARTGLRRKWPERGDLSQANSPENMNTSGPDGQDAPGSVGEKKDQAKKADVEFGLRAGALGGILMPKWLELESQRARGLEKSYAKGDTDQRRNVQNAAPNAAAKQ